MGAEGGSESALSGHLSKRNQYLDGFVGHRNLVVLGPLNEAEFLQAVDVCVDIGIVSLGRLGKGIDTAGAHTAQGVQKVHACRRQL